MFRSQPPANKLRAQLGLPPQAGDHAYDQLLYCAKGALGSSSPAFKEPLTHAAVLQSLGVTFGTYMDAYASMPTCRSNLGVCASIEVLEALREEGCGLEASREHEVPWEDVDEAEQDKCRKEFNFLQQLNIYMERKEWRYYYDWYAAVAYFLSKIDSLIRKYAPKDMADEDL
jgi:hypothetical protein